MPSLSGGQKFSFPTLFDFYREVLLIGLGSTPLPKLSIPQAITSSSCATHTVKDGAYFCYCAYVLRISRYSGFLWVVPTNTGIFLCGFNCAEKAELSKWFWYSKRKLGVTMHFSEIIKLQFGGKRHTVLCILLFFRIIVA